MPPYWSPKYLKNVDKLSKPIYKIKEETDIYVKVRDGVRLCLNIFRPDSEGKFPVLLAESGYGKERQSIKIPPQSFDSIVFDHDIEAGNTKFFVSRGYVHVILDSRGVGKSEGEYWGPYNAYEQQDTADVIEWLAQQPWCNGNIGMIGISWFGGIQFLVAAQRPPHLRAIMPAEAQVDRYRRAYNGGIITPFYYYLETSENNPKLYSAKLYGKEELERRVKERLEDPEIKYNSYYYGVLASPSVKTAFADMLLHPLDGPFWWERSGYKKFDKISIPVYVASFWGMGPNTKGAFDALNDPTLNVPKRIGIFMQWREVSLPGPNMLNPQWLRWYDYFLKGIDTGMMDEPPIMLYVMGVKRFRFEREWPLARTIWTKYYLRRMGELATTPEDEDNIPPDAFIHNPPISSKRIESLTYSTAPLPKPLELTGPVALYLHAAIDQEDANFVTRLWDVSPNGDKTLLESGYLKASHRALDEKKSKPWQPYHTHLKAEPVPPGQVIQYAIDIGPISMVFAPYHRIELDITSMDPLPQVHHHKIYLMNHLPSQTLTCYKIYRDAKYSSHLLLPVITDTPEEYYIN